MPDLDEEIQKLKSEGLSLRQIAFALGISHEAVRKRLKAVNDKDQVSTNPEYQKLTASTIKKEKVSTGPNAHESKASEKIGETVNHVSAKKTPSVTISQGVNPPGSPVKHSLQGQQRGIPRVSPGFDDLAGTIREFLESKGIELYKMQVAPEAYQVNHNGQTIRFYVQRKIGVDKAKEETE